MLSKLALRNVKRQVGNYLIYFMTVVFTVSMLFAVSNIIFSDNLLIFVSQSTQMRNILIFMMVIISSIVSFVLSYATSFMLKLRKREFGTYLTLGMTRRNILSIFITETTLICIVALALGLGLGLFIYQGLSAVMMKLLEMEFSLASYTVNGLWLTIGLVLGIFLISSLASFFYLKKVSIYDLIHGDKKVEKTVKRPSMWFALTILSLIIAVGSLVVFYTSVEASAFTTGMTFSVMAFAVSIIFFHMGFAKSIVHVLLKRKNLCGKGTNTFVLRQLSGTLSANSVMLGFLAFLLTFAVIGSNAAFVQKASQEASLNRAAPYDIRYVQNIDSETEEDIPIEQAEAVIEKYVEIQDKFTFKIYTDGEATLSQHFYSGTSYKDQFMKLSDFNALIEPLGYEPIALAHEYLVMGNVEQVEEIDWGNEVYQYGGTEYRYGGVTTEYPRFIDTYFYIVIPDSAVQGMTSLQSSSVYDIEDGKFDAAALKQELYYTAIDPEIGEEYERCDYIIKEYSRQQQNNTNAIFIIGALFVAVIFLFMAMAILALKTLSSLSDDKQRYAVLRRLGTGNREQSRTLFRQTFSFFALPFVVPLLMSIPTALICQNIMTLAKMDALVALIPVIAGVTATVMALIYLLYYTATYAIAKRTVIQGK